MKSNSIIQKTMWLLITCITFTACNQNLSSPSEIDKKTISLANKVLLSFDGYVRTANNLPIEGVIIKKENNIIAKSDKEGFFIIKGEIKEEDILSFEHPKFIPVVKILRANTKLIVWMKERSKSTLINSKEGGYIKLEKGGELKVPQNAFSFNRKPYKGEVEITASYIDVTDENEVRTAPGSYIAFDEKRKNLVPLTSYGMVEITAVIPKENAPLDLIKGNSIQVTLPIFTDNTPETVNLYEFDSKVGYWILEGKLKNIENTLQGEITSVNSTWNADDPCNDTLVCVKVKVLFQNGNPGCGVGVSGISYQGFDGPHSIGADDYVELMVCPNSVFELGACWIVCCGPGSNPSDPCCNNPQYKTTIDLSTVTMNPNGCTDIGTWIVPN